MPVKIGYQGTEGSNSQEAAIKLAARAGINDVEFVPLITSLAVANSLILNQIDYGVMAFKNNIGGYVNETSKALSAIDYEVITSGDMRIHHALFFKNSSVKSENIREIASHEQALFQCEQYISSFFPEVNRKKCPDTADAAERLKTGIFDESVAVICKKEAGISRGLFLHEENIEDSESITEFKLIKLSEFDTTNSSDLNKQKTFNENILRFLFGKTFASILILIAMGCAFLSFFLNTPFPLLGTAILGILSIVLICISGKIHSKLNVSNVVGYWKYYSSAVSGMDLNQMHDSIRIVRIMQHDDELKLEGWLPNSTKPFFVSSKILCTSKDQKHGKLVYWYNGTVDIRSSASINGVTVLEWNVENKNKQINKMLGWYLGATSKEIGTMVYTRISREEFDRFRHERKILI